MDFITPSDFPSKYTRYSCLGLLVFLLKPNTFAYIVSGLLPITKITHDIIKAITTNTSNIELLLEWKTSTDSHQTLQDAKIDRNTEYAQELNDKIDAKVIEAGGVAFDLEPTKDSNNAVFSGGVYKYIDEKFVVLTPEEYESLVIKNSNTFYFILE